MIIINQEENVIIIFNLLIDKRNHKRTNNSRKYLFQIGMAGEEF